VTLKKKDPLTCEGEIESKELFESTYLSWKGWDEGAFGVLSREQQFYLSAQLKDAECSIDPEMKILEIGFGNGKFLAYASNLGAKIAGTEVNLDLVSMGKKCGFDVHHADSLLFFPKETYDLVAAFDVLEHIPQENLLAFFKQVRDILRPGGRFLARFPNGDSPFGLINQNGDMTHVTSIGSSKIRHLAEAAGMEAIFIRGESEPILATSGIFLLHRFFSKPIKAILNGFVNVVILGRCNIAFFSLNLVAVLKKY
jgi:SAM-dependent methyltransferase